MILSVESGEQRTLRFFIDLKPLGKVEYCVYSSLRPRTTTFYMAKIDQFADFIWNIKDHIRDEYSEKDYEEVILPFTLLRRLDCVLEQPQSVVSEAFEQYKTLPAGTQDKLLKRAAGQNFYNTSGFSLASLIKTPADLRDNFDAYLAGFGPNIKDILYNFSGGEEKGLGPIYQTLDRKGLLLIVTKEFSKIDLHPDVVDNHEMGTIFEILIRKAKETTNDKAGQYYTPREIVELLVELVFANDAETLKQPGMGVKIYDPCCGTGGMLTTAKEYLLKNVNSELKVYLFGQEINEQTYAIAKSDILIKGEDAENIKHGNTIKTDKLIGERFSYMLTNPPFGDDWKNMRDYVEKEAERGFDGRFGAGLPDVSDGSLLFLQHMMNKIEPSGSVLGIIFNGSPLFNGDAGGGWSGIRGWLLENDWLDTIVALPKDLFYGTGIGTYIWIVTNRKQPGRAGKVQLINGTHPVFYEKLRKSLGKKQVKISDAGIAEIKRLYRAYQPEKQDMPDDMGRLRPVDISLIFDRDDFKYTKVTVERPLRLRYTLAPDMLTRLTEHDKFREMVVSKKGDPEKVKLEREAGERRQRELLAALDQLQPDAPYADDRTFFYALQLALSFKLSKGQIKLLRDTLGERDEMARLVFDNPLDKPQPGERPLPDADLRDAESIPAKDDIDAYFAREVLPFAPDAWMDRDKDRTGYEIPFTKHFYEYRPLRDITEIMADIEALEDDTEELLHAIQEA